MQRVIRIEAACARGDIEMVKLVLSMQPVRHVLLQGALSNAAFSGHLETVSYLAETVGVTFGHDAAFANAAANAHLDIMHYIAMLGRMHGRCMEWALMSAVDSGVVDAVRLVIVTAMALLPYDAERSLIKKAWSHSDGKPIRSQLYTVLCNSMRISLLW